MTFASEKIRAFSVGDRVNLASSKTRGDTTHHVETSFPKDDAPAVALRAPDAPSSIPDRCLPDVLSQRALPPRLLL